MATMLKLGGALYNIYTKGRNMMKTYTPCYTKITKFNPCIQNRIKYSLPAFQADCFSNKEMKRLLYGRFAKKN